VILEFLGKVFDGRLQRVVGIAAQIAERRDRDHLAKVGEHMKVRLAEAVVPHGPEQLVHALCALATGNALAAELCLRVLHKATRDIDHAAVLVEHRDDAVAAAHAVGLELLKVQGQIEMLLDEKAAARAANLHRLKLFPIRNAAADPVDRLSDGGRLLGNVYIAGVGDVTLE